MIASEGNTDRAIYFNLACVDFAQSDFASAIERMKAYGIELDQNLSWDCALWLRCHHHLALLDEALAYFESRQKSCTDAVAFGVASLIAVDASKLELARAWSKSALAVNPLQREALVANATIQLADYDTQGASKSLQFALHDAPKDGRIWSALGMAKLLEQDLGSATAAFESAVRYMPNHIGTWHGLGWCYVLKQDIAKAQKAFESAFALDRNFAENHGALAVVQALRGQKASAELSIERALKLDSRSLSARYAEAILSGDVSNSERFSKLVQRVAGQHKDAQGRSLSEVVLGKSKPLES
jgi:Flp pilus assembly protein TadD